MRLIYLEIHGVKGAEVQTSIGPLVLLHGPNGARKSAWFDGLALLVNGWHPSLPHTVDGVMQLADGDEISVAGQFDDGTRVSRSWSRREITRGKRAGQFVIETDVRIEAGGETTTGEAAKATIAEHIGPPGSLSLIDLLDASDAQRRAMLLDAGAARVHLTPEQVSLDLQSRAIDDQVRAWDGAESVAAWIVEQFEAAKDRSSEARRRVTTTRAAVEALAEIKDPIDPAEVGASRSVLSKMREAHTRLREDWATRQQQHRDDLQRAREHNERHRRAQRTVEDCGAEERKIRAQTTDDDEIDRIAQQIDDLETGFDGIPDAEEERDHAAERVERARRRLQDARTALEQAQESRRGADQALQRLIQSTVSRPDDLDAAEEKIDDLQREIKALTTTRARVASEHLDTFDPPHCDACGQPLNNATLDTLDRRIAHKREALAQADRAAKPLQDAHDEAHRARKQEIAQATMDQAEARTTEAARQQDENEARGELSSARTNLETTEKRLRDLLAQRDDLRRKLSALQRTTEIGPRIAELDERRREAQRVLDEGTRDVAALEQAQDHARASAEQAIRTSAEAVTEAESTLREMEERLAAEKHAAALRVQLHDAQHDLDEALRVEQQIGPRGMMGEMVKQLLQPFVDAVNACLDGLDLGTFGVRLLDPRGNDVFRLGVDRFDGFAPIEALSSGEALVVSSAAVLGLGILSDRPFRPLLLDHIERVDGRRRSRLLARLAELVADGTVEQVLAAGCMDEIPVEPWDVREVE